MKFDRILSGKWFYHLAVFAFRSFVRLVYGLRVSGAEHVPPPSAGGAVVACNHISSFDPPVLGVSVPREIHFMAKRELFESLFSRMLMLGLRAFPVDRERSDMGAIKEALRLLRSGIAVGIFIQGTRNRGDAEARGGAAFLAQRAAVPLVPAAVWREGRAFRIRFGEPIMPAGKGREAMAALTDELVARIAALLPPHVQPPSSPEAAQEA